jgi:phosphatidylglycerophosphate synthase
LFLGKEKAMFEIATMILGIVFTFVVAVVIFALAALAVHCLEKFTDWLDGDWQEK